MRRFILASVGLLLGTACAPVAATNPSAFSLDVRDGQLIGTYNPTGWSSEEVRRILPGSNCAGNRLASYTETTRPDGLVDFVATCA